MSRTGSTRPSTWVTSGSSNARTTSAVASASRMFPRKRLPSPSPRLAPRTSPAMSVNVTVAGITFGGLKERSEPIEPRVGNRHDAGVGLDGGERVVPDSRACLGHGVEQRRLAGVGQADDADGEAQILSSSKAVCSARTASRTRGRSMMQVTWISLVAIIWMLTSFSASARKIFA